jgi:hypothetical protein
MPEKIKSLNREELSKIKYKFLPGVGLDYYDFEKIDSGEQGDCGD